MLGISRVNPDAPLSRTFFFVKRKDRIMIETEKQRRWWFATHPDFSGSQKAVRNRGQQEGGDKVRAEDVDAYVDNALKYVDGPVAVLLESLKRNFGTASDSRMGEYEGGILGLSARYDDPGWVSLAGYYGDGGYIRLPTTDELLRLPETLVREFYRGLDRLLQNNPLLIDPTALEHHHGLPKEFINYFLDCGLRIEDFISIMRAADHRLKPDGAHTGEGKGGRWNQEWRQFIKENPAKNTEKHRKRVKDKWNEMKKKYRIDEEAIL
jgi:hypothetical protein